MNDVAGPSSAPAYRRRRAIRILIADLSDRLRALVHGAVVDQPDLVTIADADGEVEMLLHAEAADVAVVGMSGEHLPAVAERLLDEYPDIGVVAIDVDRQHGVILQLLTELSPPALSAAIRQAAAGLPRHDHLDKEHTSCQPR